MYRQPDGNITEAFDTLGSTLDQVKDIHKFELLLMGDFNADCSKKNGPVYNRVKKLETDHQLLQMIREPTRYSKKNHTIIDLAFTNMKQCSSAGIIN